MESPTDNTESNSIKNKNQFLYDNGDRDCSICFCENVELIPLFCGDMNHRCCPSCLYKLVSERKNTPCPFCRRNVFWQFEDVHFSDAIEENKDKLRETESYQNPSLSPQEPRFFTESTHRAPLIPDEDFWWGGLIRCFSCSVYWKVQIRRLYFAVYS